MQEWEEPPHDLPSLHRGLPVLPRCCHPVWWGPGLLGPLHPGPRSRGSSVQEAPSRVDLSCDQTARLSRGRASISAISHLEVHQKLEEGHRRGNCFAGVTSALLTPTESGGWSQASPLSPTCSPWGAPGLPSDWPCAGSLTTHSTSSSLTWPRLPLSEASQAQRPQRSRGQNSATYSGCPPFS